MAVLNAINTSRKVGIELTSEFINALLSTSNLMHAYLLPQFFTNCLVPLYQQGLEDNESLVAKLALLKMYADGGDLSLLRMIYISCYEYNLFDNRENYELIINFAIAHREPKQSLSFSNVIEALIILSE